MEVSNSTLDLWIREGGMAANIANMTSGRMPSTAEAEAAEETNEQVCVLTALFRLLSSREVATRR